MDDIEQIIKNLRDVQHLLSLNNEIISVAEVGQAIRLIERLRPKQMTDDEACILLNEIAYDGADDWTPDGDGLGYIRSGSLKQGMGTWTAHAIAEKLLRGKEASTG